MKVSFDVSTTIYHCRFGVCPLTTVKCPLCKLAHGEPFFQDKKRDYLRCPVCCLVFVPADQFISLEQEKAEYDLHENSADDQGYRRFLARLLEPMIQRLPSHSHGLDFGSGPGPTLSVMFEEVGHEMAIYDLFYAPDESALQQTYDFITATEVAEHLHRPREELDRLWGCLRPGGWLGLMTKRVIDVEAFAKWHYKNDPTHVCYFSADTFRWLAKQWGASLTFLGNDVVLFHRDS